MYGKCQVLYRYTQLLHYNTSFLRNTRMIVLGGQNETIMYDFRETRMFSLLVDKLRCFSVFLICLYSPAFKRTSEHTRTHVHYTTNFNPLLQNNKKE